MTANEITAALLIEIPKKYIGTRLWRQNTGSGLGLSTIKLAVEALRRKAIAEAIQILSRRPISYGIEGGGDLCGLIPPHGRILQIEVKAEGDRQSDKQKAFQAMIERAGGAYIVARSVEDVTKYLDVCT